MWIQCCSEKLPAGQNLQKDADVAPSDIENVPTLHSKQSCEDVKPLTLEKVPALQEVHRNEPSSEAYVPGLHASQVPFILRYPALQIQEQLLLL